MAEYQSTSYQADSPGYEDEEDTTPRAAGSKRLFSNRQSRQLSEDAEGNYTDYNTYLSEENRWHSDKRHRNSDWPLPSSSRPPSITSSTREPLRARNAPNSPTSRRGRAVSAQRPSKFVEGSMNDRVSAVPPIPYLSDVEPEDELLSEYDAIEPSRGRKIARTRKFTSKTRNTSSSVASRFSQNEDGARNSIYKFGKSIAASFNATSFNPGNWKIWSKPQPQVSEETEQMKVLRERQSRAERIYRELKESGQFKDSTVKFPTHVQEEQVRKVELESPHLHLDHLSKRKHDSGIDFKENESTYQNGSTRTRRMSTEEKRMGRIFLEPPVLDRTSVGGSPVSRISTSQAPSDTSSPNKGLHFKKLSLSNLKRTLATNSSTSLFETGQQHARRIPSRKDLQKQQKLVKRVSDLEGKLQSAREQLSASLAEPLPAEASQLSLASQASSQILDAFPAPPAPPTHQTHSESFVRKRFVPGALASLPSERLLTGYVDNDEEEEEDVETGIGMAVTSDSPQKNEERKDRGMRSNASPAWDGGPLHRRRSLSRDRPMRSVEEEVASMVKNSVVSAISGAATTISEPSTKAYDPKDSDYVPDATEQEFEEQEMEEVVEDTQTTPKALPKQSPPSKKRKSTFEGLADDGGLYKPEDTTEESDLASEVKKLVTPRRQKTTAAITPRSNKSQAMKPVRNSSRKLQKVSATQAKDPNAHVAAPPARAPPPPPTENKHPKRTSSLKPTVKSPPPSKRLSKSKPPPMPTNRQQSSSPPPSSAFTGISSEQIHENPFQRQTTNEPSSSQATTLAFTDIPKLEYKKPSSQRQVHIASQLAEEEEEEADVNYEMSALPYQNPFTQRQTIQDTGSRTFADEDGDEEAEDFAYSATPQVDEDVPPMPVLPSLLRLHNGDVIQTTESQFLDRFSSPRGSTPTSSIGNGSVRVRKTRGGTANGGGSAYSNSNASKVSKTTSKRRESKRLSKKKEYLSAEVVEKETDETEEKKADGKEEEGAYEWPAELGVF